MVCIDYELIEWTAEYMLKARIQHMNKIAIITNEYKNKNNNNLMLVVVTAYRKSAKTKQPEKNIDIGVNKKFHITSIKNLNLYSL